MPQTFPFYFYLFLFHIISKSGLQFFATILYLPFISLPMQLKGNPHLTAISSATLHSYSGAEQMLVIAGRQDYSCCSIPTVTKISPLAFMITVCFYAPICLFSPLCVCTFGCFALHCLSCQSPPS